MVGLVMDRILILQEHLVVDVNGSIERACHVFADPWARGAIPSIPGPGELPR